MPPKKRANLAAAGSGAGGSQIEPAKLKVGELRTELEKRGLETEGKKAELVARLEDALKAESAPPKSKKIKVEAPPTSGGGGVDYSKMKVSELREQLEAQGLDTAGKKAELVARLEAAAGGGGAGGGAAGKGVKKEADGAKKAPKTKKKEPAAAKEEPQEDDEPMEETDFGKAVRALTTADTGKKKKGGAPKQRKVDCGLPGRVVVDDWDCMLNQTNIGHNNNKFYVIQLLQCGLAYNLWTRWGRVGEPGQNETKYFSSLEEAQKAFKKKFSDKTKNKWENRDNFVPAPGKYTLIEMDEDGDDEEMVQKLEALDETDSGPVAKVRPSTLDTPTQNLIKLIFNTDMFNHAMKSMEIDTKKMPLGKLSKAQIAKGFEALEAVETALDECASRTKLAELTSKFYTIIPHSFGRTIPPVIDNKEMLQKKFDMLVVLGDIELAQGLQKDQDKKKKAEAATEVPHPLDVQYESMKANLALLDTSSHEYQVILKYLKATEPQWRSLQLQHVWRVDRFKVEDRFKAHDAIENRRLLWHGTNVAVVAAILKSGLRIMPHSGGRVGKGIYLASENSKSAGYVRCAADGTGIMFLNEAALGKEHLITMDNYQLTAPPSGYDSIIAKGRTEPDPKEDSSLTLDGKTVTVPQGKPKPTQHSTSNFSQSEYLVYKESQTRIRYMLQLKFH